MTKSTYKYSKPIIGLLGGVGAGKSAVAKEFQKLGCVSIDADRVNHAILQSPEVIEVLIGWWGDEIIENDTINRAKVAEIVFNNPKKLQKLTDFLYPLIFKQISDTLPQLLAQKNVKAVILDAPVLLEAKQQHLCDILVFVDVDEAIRHQRIQKNRNWDKKRIKNVENSQISLDIKAKMSDYIVNNSSGFPDLARQVASVFSQIF